MASQEELHNQIAVKAVGRVEMGSVTKPENTVGENLIRRSQKEGYGEKKELIQSSVNSLTPNTGMHCFPEINQHTNQT